MGLPDVRSLRRGLKKEDAAEGGCAPLSANTGIWRIALNATEAHRAVCATAIAGTEPAHNALQFFRRQVAQGLLIESKLLHCLWHKNSPSQENYRSEPKRGRLFAEKILESETAENHVSGPDIEKIGRGERI